MAIKQPRPKLEQKLNKLLRLTFLIAIKKPQAFNTSLGSLNLGPEGRTRTDTSSLTADFESAASTNFTTSGRVRCFVLRIITCLILLSNPISHLLLTFKSLRYFSSYKHQAQRKNTKKTILRPIFCNVLDVCNSPTFLLIFQMNLSLATH